MLLPDKPPVPEASPDVVIERLERRLQRERDARRQAEEISERGMRDLWLANQDLDTRVEERTKDLEHTLEQLRIASSARERFLSTLSHEMRTPLNGILGMLEILGPHLVGDQGNRYLDVAVESAERLMQLVSRLLDLVALDSGSFTTERTTVQVASLADDIGSRWQTDALRSGHLLTVWTHGMLECSIDEARVLQIANELIDNAVTHASPGALRVEIDVDDVRFELSVTDSGPGISPELIAELLNADFSMVDDSTARTAQGLGLGLGICRRIAEAIGGTLELISDGTTGSVARLQMPATDDTSEQPEQRTPINQKMVIEA